MKPAPFRYHAAETVEEVRALLGELADDAKILAGGQSLVPMLNLRLARFEHLVDIGRVAALRQVRDDGDTVTIGAATVDAIVGADATIAAKVPLLTAATPYIGHLQIRNRGTIGGSIAHADPAAEYPAVAMALDATMHVGSTRGERTVEASEFFSGFWSTALEPDEVLEAVTFGVWSDRAGFGVAEFARRHGDFAIAGAVAGVDVGSDGRIERASLALFGVGATPLRAAAAEAAVLGQTLAETDPVELGRVAFAAIDDITDDPQVPAAYRRNVGEAMVADAWRRATDDATRKAAHQS